METSEQQYDYLKEISLLPSSSGESGADAAAAKRPAETEKLEREESAESAAKRAKLEAGSSPKGSSKPAAVLDYLSAKRAELGMSAISPSAPMAVVVSDETCDGDSGAAPSVPIATPAGREPSPPGGDGDVIVNSRARNVRYLRMIRESRAAYAGAATRGERRAIVSSLMGQWRGGGGRFLTRRNGAEAEADDETVQRKITAALRKTRAGRVAVVPLRPGRHVLPQLVVVPQKVILEGPDYDCDEAARLFLATEDERAARKTPAASGTARGEDGKDGRPPATRAKPARKARPSVMETPPGGAGSPAVPAPSRPPAAPRTPALLLSEGPAPSLGRGWVTRTFRRTSGRSAGTRDTYFYSPGAAIKFRSLRSCRVFIGVLAEEGVGGDEAVALRVYRERGHKL